MEYTLSLKLKNDDRAFFGPGPAKLLALIQAGDSLHQAAGKLGMAYSKAWRILRSAESQLGFLLLERQRGGTGGGGSALTADAVLLLEKYGAFQRELYKLGDKLFAQYFSEV